MTKAKGRKALTDAEVATFAKRIYQRDIFVSWMMSDHDQKQLMTMVFMPLLLMDTEQRKRMLKDKISFLWAVYGDQVPGRGINGYPMFTRFGMWTLEEGQRVHAKLKEIEKTLEAL